MLPILAQNTVLRLSEPLLQYKMRTLLFASVCVDQDLKNDNFLDAKDFFRLKKDSKNGKIYHHIGIYAFTSTALSKYVKLPRSKLEMERNLEQMRAMENNMKIKVGLCSSTPLGVDTEEDLKIVSEEMN